MMSEIMEVPLPRAASRRLISFFTFQISMFFSASFAWGALMMSGDVVNGLYAVSYGSSFDRLNWKVRVCVGKVEIVRRR